MGESSTMGGTTGSNPPNLGPTPSSGTFPWARARPPHAQANLHLPASHSSGFACQARNIGQVMFPGSWDQQVYGSAATWIRGGLWWPTVAAYGGLRLSHWRLFLILELVSVRVGTQNLATASLKPVQARE